VPEQLESPDEEVYWEIEKVIRLALKANPNVLECLYSPLVEICEPIARELLDIRPQYVHRTYNAYVLSQFKTLEQDLRRHDRRLRWKHVMHLIRLLLYGVTVLKHGFVPLRVDEQRSATERCGGRRWSNDGSIFTGTSMPRSRPRPCRSISIMNAPTIFSYGRGASRHPRITYDRLGSAPNAK
jgi:hypothetical protein